MPKPALTMAILAAIGTGACIDVTPTSERDRTPVLVPDVLRPAVELALSTYADLQTQATFTPVYASCPEVARRASSAEDGVALTLHPAWADYIGDRGAIERRQAVAVDSLVVAGGTGVGAAGAMGDPGGLLALTRPIGMPSTESDAVGMYAREALIRYGIWSQVERQVTVFPTAPDALDALARGEVGAAFTTGSAAREAGLPILLTLDEGFHQPVLVEVLLFEGAGPDARMLFDYLVGPQGRGAFTSKGLRAAQ